MILSKKKTLVFFAQLAAALLAASCTLYAQTAGAPMPFVDFNAATSSGAQTNGNILGPGRYFGQLALEAENRQAVILVGGGKFVSFTLTQPANAVTIHYAIPDAPQGNGLTEPLSVYVNNKFATSLSLTSAYSWLYGAYPYDKTPTLGTDRTQPPHDFYNDVRYLFPSTLPAGTVVKFQIDAGDNSPWYIINTADFEVVPAAIGQPANSINVTQAPYSADNTGGTDVTTALQNAINAGSSAGKAIYLPQGTYKVSAPLLLNNVTVEGAGEWYTVLTGSDVGFTGNQSPASTNVNVSNLALFDDATIRNNSTSADTGFNGGFSNSTISNVWIQNEKSGIFVLGPTTGLTLNGLRIMDLKADGINFWAQGGAITNSTIENSYIRNSQDDSIAMYAEPNADQNITITQNTVISPGLANAVAVYGSGSGDMISNNLLMDPVQAGSCIQDGLRFNAITNDGPLTIQGNTLLRCGVFDPGFFFGWGSIVFYPADGNIASTENISNNTIENSPYSAYMFLGPNSTTGVSVSGDTLSNVGTFVVHTQGSGTASISNTSASGVTAGGYLNLGCSFAFNLTTGSDSGWSQTPENCNLPVANPLWVYPDVATFQTTQGTPVVQKVAVYNASYEVTTLGAITASSGFTVSADPSYPCGSSLQAGQNGGGSEPGYCFVDITFNASASGITTGTLTVPSSAPDSPATVMLVGSTGGNSVAITPTVTPASLSFGNVPVGTTSSAQTVTLSNPSGAATMSVGIATSTSFSQTNTCGSTLAGGASCTISVTFTATAAGVVSGALSITNSETSSPLTVSLSGTGAIAPTAPTGLSASPAGNGVIGLAWTASAGTAPITYNIYRGTTSGGESGTPIASNVTSSTYADTSVTGGATYYYEISATNSIGSSGKSAEISATAESAAVQIDAGGAVAGTFAADEYFNTGSEATTTSTVVTANVINPAPEAVYQSVRWASSFTYTIPGLTAGANYTVRLHFNEMTFTGAGQRVFNVAINGTSVLSNFDVYATAGGQNVAVIKQFNTTATSSGNIVISFTQGTADNPDVAGIEVLSAGSAAGGGGCTPTAITPYLQVGTGAWQQTATASIASGTSVTFGPQPLSGTWSWSGTGGFSSTARQVTVTPTSNATYTATYTNSGGCQSTQTFNITVTGGSCTPTAITPYLQVGTGAWQQATTATVASGTSVTFGPQPVTGGTWSWTGPGGFSSTARQVTVTPTSTGTYTATYTNAGGCQSTQTFTLTVSTSSGPLIQIDAGGGAVSPFIVDTDFNNGNEASTTTTVSTTGVTNPAPEAVYQSARWAPSFTYIVPGLTAGFSYTVRLHFAELTWTAAGERVFNVAINGTTVLSNFDIFATAGGQYKALVEQFTATADSLGQITISFSKGTADNPEVAGIEILGSGTLGSALPDVVDVDSGSSTAVSPFVADEDFSTGNEASSGATINTTHTATPAPAAVYQTCRWNSSFTYTIPGLTAGNTYAVRLHFAELTWTAAGQRMFNVAINGNYVLNNFDIFATAGAQNQALTEQFNATANSSGQIVISLTQGTADNPEINGIEILQ